MHSKFWGIVSKRETLIFETVMDLVMNEIFHCFYVRYEFLQFFFSLFLWKEHFSICRTMLKYFRGKNEFGVVKTDAWRFKMRPRRLLYDLF